jgi:hypothetical protein
MVAVGQEREGFQVRHVRCKPRKDFVGDARVKHEAAQTRADLGKRLQVTNGIERAAANL